MGTAVGSQGIASLFDATGSAAVGLFSGAYHGRYFDWDCYRKLLLTIWVTMDLNHGASIRKIIETIYYWKKKKIEGRVGRENSFFEQYANGADY